MQKIIIPFLIIFLTFIIYSANDDNLVDYMSIGDSLSIGINSYGNKSFGYNDYIKTYLENNNILNRYNNNFSKQNYTIKQLNTDIKNNIEINYNDKIYNIKKELREADILTISIGLDELVDIINNYNNINNYNEIDNLVENMNELIKTISKLTSGNIILIGYYNPFHTYTKELDRIFVYIDDKYNTIAKKYSIKYISIYETIKKDNSYLPNKNDYHLISKGYFEIAKLIINYLEK